MNAGTGILIGLGVLVVGGVGVYYATRPSSSGATPTTTPQVPAGADRAAAPNPTAATACQNAAQLAAIAKVSGNPENERPSYNYWAAQCTASGGSPPPFPS